MKNIKKIEQEDNFNSYSQLYIVNDEVYKIYTEKSSKVDYNLNNIKKLINNKSKYNVKELVLPNNILEYNGFDIGYSMPYIKGKNLYEFLDNSTKAEKELIIKKIYESIKEINDIKITICDFHEKNIIIDNNLDIHFIDCDSFAINNNELIDGNEPYLGKYIDYACYSGLYFEKHNISTDYYSLFMSIVNYISTKQNISLESIIKRYYESNSEIVNKYLKVVNINDFSISLENILCIVSNIENISFKEKFTMSDEQLKQEILEIKKLISKIK